jgi:hypothetical protein
MRHDFGWAVVALILMLGVYLWLVVLRRRLEAKELSRGHGDYSKVHRRRLLDW